VREYGRVKYKSDLADRMLCFFEEYDEGFGAPSFAKFARSLGITVAHLEGYRKHKKFDIAYRECSEIRRDYLIDMALDKRFDPTFVRHLIANEKDGVTDESLDSITVRVIE
jgi:thiamine pyrophosphate-dependent acetolactate synthase large subunit-like protein